MALFFYDKLHEFAIMKKYELLHLKNKGSKLQLDKFYDLIYLKQSKSHFQKIVRHLLTLKH